MIREPQFIDTEYNDVCDFHIRFGIMPESCPKLPAPDVFEFRLKFLREEIDELEEAYRNHDLVKFVDALIDLSYVTKGTGILAGFSPELWGRLRYAVHEANMLKRRVESADKSKRGHRFDVVKPTGWVSPEPFMRALIENEIERRK